MKRMDIPDTPRLWFRKVHSVRNAPSPDRLVLVYFAWNAFTALYAYAKAVFEH
jgi:hypothetical protein